MSGVLKLLKNMISSDYSDVHAIGPDSIMMMMMMLMMMMLTTMNQILGISRASERCALRCAVRLVICLHRSAVVPAPVSARRAVVDLAVSPHTAAADTFHTYVPPYTHLRVRQNSDDRETRQSDASDEYVVRL